MSRELTGPRWSTAATICTRQAALQAIGVHDYDLDEQVLRRLHRGTQIGKVIAEQVKAELAEEGRHVVLEHEAEWPTWTEPIGTNHADLFEPGKKVIEVVSSSTGVLPARKPLQAAGYAIHRGVEEADILIVDSSTYNTRVVPVNVKGLAPKVQRIEEQMVAAVRDGVIPERDPDLTPTSWPCFECPVRRTCMADYVPTPFVEMPGLEEHAERLAVLEHQAKRVRKLEKPLEEERKQIKTYLARRMEDKTWYRVGDVTLRKTFVPGRRTFDFGAAEKAGWVIPPHLLPFVKEGEGFERFIVKDAEE